METQATSEEKKPRESGAIIHRRETTWQIYLPFLLGIGVLVLAFAVVGIPSDPAWRDRAQAIGDFLYTFLCTLPILVCLLPIYVLILAGIYGMRKVHSGTERPLRKLENLSESLAERIETATKFVNEKTISFSTLFEPLDTLFSMFDQPTPSDKEIDNDV